MSKKYRDIMIFLLNLYDACNRDYTLYVLKVSELEKSGEIKTEDIPKSLLKSIQSLQKEKEIKNGLFN